MRRGLVFGKMMPLHRGHQLMIDTALAECDDVTLVIYDSRPEGDYPEMPVWMRLGWVRTLYPQLHDVLAVPDPITGGDGDDPIHAPTYAAQIAFLGPFDRVYSSEPDYEDFARFLGAQHVVVDAFRTLVPISGTQIRSNPYLYRGFMDPVVYASLIQKVVFVGTESTGKTTLARTLAELHGTLWTHEFGRELWEAQGLEGSFSDHLKMATRQHEREQAAARHANRFLFCDTNAWTTLHWSLRSYGYADARLWDLAERTMAEYIWVLCDNDFDWVQDGTRELVGSAADAFQAQQVDDLRARRVGYHLATGTLEERVAGVSEMLALQAPHRSLAHG